MTNNFSYLNNQRFGTDTNTIDNNHISDTYADMLRQDYDDWKMRFKPFDSLMEGFLFDDDVRDQQRNNALNYVDNAYDESLQRGTAMRNLLNRNHGVQLSDADKRASNQQIQISKGATQSKARRNMFDYLGQRDIQLLSGGL